MVKPIGVKRVEFSVPELRAVAAGMRDGAAVRRLLAIAMVLEGYSREQAARCNGMQRQTLRDWVYRYNKDGVAGLRSLRSPGRPPSTHFGS
ncbi:MAG: helix-turn-helix domain-containing protein [Acetobacteraceae bacterium]